MSDVKKQILKFINNIAVDRGYTDTRAMCEKNITESKLSIKNRIIMLGK